jgi:hypothetical protein
VTVARTAEKRTHRCNRCGKVKPVAQFYTRQDGTIYNNSCKPCYCALINRTRAEKRANTPPSARRRPGRPTKVENLGFEERPSIRLNPIQRALDELSERFAEANE